MCSIQRKTLLQKIST
uniref:Uncharacterized protein n=1 Tax=Anopheles quadriannulatus TaxID=34691 RepID=A0A182XT81_ANOQN